LARNRYGWQKRAKELARKQKKEEKIRRRQGKTSGPTTASTPPLNDAEVHNPAETEVTEAEQPVDPEQPT
jgi:hypothetical protein